MRSDESAHHSAAAIIFHRVFHARVSNWDVLRNLHVKVIILVQQQAFHVSAGRKRPLEKGIEMSEQAED